MFIISLHRFPHLDERILLAGKLRAANEEGRYETQ
jgi:hypothetical protein